MSVPEKKFGSLWDSLAIIVMLVAAFVILDRYTTLFDQQATPSPEGEKITLENDLPELGEGGLVTSTVLSIFTATNTYTPPPDVFNPPKYKKEAKLMALNGEFQTAEFIIEATPNNDTKNILSVNLNYVSGIYGITRFKDRKIIVNDEKAVFTKDNPLSIPIDLMAEIRLSGTLQEVENGLNSKDLSLWSKIQPPPKDGAVFQFLFVPIAYDGKIGDTTITKLDFEYRCVEPNGCQARLCLPGESRSTCLEKAKKL